MQKIVGFKKAFLDQVFLGFFLFFVLIGLGATVADEIELRSELRAIEEIATNSSKAIKEIYDTTKDYTKAEAIAKGIISQSPIGQRLLKEQNIEFVWYGKDEVASYVVTKIDGYSYKGFWYSIVGDGYFTIPIVSAIESLAKEERRLLSFDNKYLGESDESKSIIGTYTTTADGKCIVTPATSSEEMQKLRELYPKYSNEEFYPRTIVGNTSAKGNINLSYQDFPGNTKFYFIVRGFDSYSFLGREPKVEIFYQNGASCKEPSFKFVDQIGGLLGLLPVINHTLDKDYVVFEDAIFNEGVQQIHKISKDAWMEYQNFLNTGGIKCEKSQNGICIKYKDSTTRVKLFGDKVRVGAYLKFENFLEFAREEGIDYTKDPNGKFIINTTIVDEKWTQHNLEKEIFLEVQDYYDTNQVIFDDSNEELNQIIEKLDIIRQNKILVEQEEG